MENTEVTEPVVEEFRIQIDSGESYMVAAKSDGNIIPISEYATMDEAIEGLKGTFYGGEPLFAARITKNLTDKIIILHDPIFIKKVTDEPIKNKMGENIDYVI